MHHMHSQDQHSVLLLQYFVIFVRYVKSITQHLEKFEILYIYMKHNCLLR